MLHGLSRARFEASVICSLGNLPSGADLQPGILTSTVPVFVLRWDGPRLGSARPRFRAQLLLSFSLWLWASNVPSQNLGFPILCGKCSARGLALGSLGSGDRVITDGSWATPRITQFSCVYPAPSPPTTRRLPFHRVPGGLHTAHPTPKLFSGENKQSQRCSWLAPLEQDVKSRALTDVLWRGLPGSI